MSWIGGFCAGVGAVTLGVLLGKSGRKRRRGKHRFVRGRSGFNPGWRQRRLERETLAYLREARITLEALNNAHAPPIDAEFIEPVPANGADGSHTASPEAKEK